MKKKLISIVSGCYNEENNLHEYYRRVTAVMDSLPQYDFECLLADNCSEDNSAAILKEIAAKDSRFKIVLNLKNYGPDRSGVNLWYRAVAMLVRLSPPPIIDLLITVILSFVINRVWMFGNIMSKTIPDLEG